MATVKIDAAELDALRARVAQAEADVAAARAAVPVAIPEADMAAIRAAAEARIRALGTRPCACGCGGSTKSTFVPGHDARLKSRLIEEGKRAWLAAQAAPVTPAE